MVDQPNHPKGQDPWREYDAAALLAMSGDVSILLSADNVVADVIVPQKAQFDADLRAKWLGRAFEQIVARDSVGKIEPLLGLKTKMLSSADRWRHLNFVVEGAADIPLLAKHFRIETSYGYIRQVVCRDLRPMTELNAHWQNENSRLLEQVAQATAKNEANSFVGDLVGSAPLKYIMDAAVDEVARICIADALKSCNGNEIAAALLLGISPEELRWRWRGTSLHS